MKHVVIFLFSFSVLYFKTLLLNLFSHVCNTAKVRWSIISDELPDEQKQTKLRMFLVCSKMMSIVVQEWCASEF